jgi:hypothetical protein
MSDNPPAFPLRGVDNHGFYTPDQIGMTLRDYFAVHADQPGVSEIVSAAGLRTDGYYVLFGDGGDKQPFNEWWNNIPLHERLELSAIVRFAIADAMLKERSK